MAILLPACGKKSPVPPSVEGFDFSAPRQAWKHLDEPTRQKIDAGLAKRPKPGLSIIHSTGSEGVSAAALADNHRRIRGLADGMAYHFVIGNGRGIPDGSLLVGPRWEEGKASEGLQDTRMETDAVTIALVGDLNRRDPTLAQLEALDELLDYLSGKIGPHPVRLHREVENSPRGCPGQKFPLQSLRQAYPQ